MALNKSMQLRHQDLCFTVISKNLKHHLTANDPMIQIQEKSIKLLQQRHSAIQAKHKLSIAIAEDPENFV